MSEKSLDKLITTLRSEAIEAAENQAMEILENARQQAEKIVKNAEDKRESLLQTAENEAKGTLAKGESALKQAARDLTISLHNDILKLLGAVLETEVKAAFTPNLIEDAVRRAVENVGSGVTLKLPETMENELAAKIQEKLKGSDQLASISLDNSLSSGFSIAKTDQGWSYQVTPEAVAELLNRYLSPKWIQLLRNK